MAYVVGLDVGTKTISGAVFEGTPKSFRLVDFFVEDIPEPAHPSEDEEVTDADESESPLGDLLKRIVDERGLHGADFVASLDTSEVVVRDLKLDFAREDQIDKVIHFEAENHLITFDIDDMILDYLKVADDGVRSDVVVCAASREVVGDRLAALKAGGVDPTSLDLDSTALYNAYTRTLNHAPDRTCLLVDVGANTTTVSLIQDGTLRKVRSLRLGAYLGPYNSLQIAGPDSGTAVEGGEGERGPGFELPDASAIESRFDEIENALRRLEPGSSEPVTLGGGDGSSDGSPFQEDEPIAILSDEEYERVVDDSTLSGLGLGEESTVAESEATDDDAVPRYDYHDFLERLAMEIQRTFASNLLRNPLDLICLTGGMAQKEEARRFFSEEFDVDTISLDFEDAFEMDVDLDVREDINRLGGVAVGLALRELGFEECRLDFRQDEFRYERHFEKLKRPLMTMGVCLCAMFIVMIFNLIADFKYWGKMQKDIYDREVQYYEAFFEEKPKLDEPLLARVALREMGLWNKLLGERSGNLPIILDDVKALSEIGKVLKEARQVQNMDFEVGRMELKLNAEPTMGKRKSGEPKYKVDGKSELTLTSSERNLGSAFQALFREKSTMWDAVPTEKANAKGVITINLALTPRKDYLMSLE